MSQLLELVNNARHASMKKKAVILMTAAVIGTASAIVNALPAAIDTEFANQDSQVERHKLRLAGYYDDQAAKSDEAAYRVSDEARTARHANDVIAKAYGRKS